MKNSKTLGPLERKVMQCLWDNDRRTVRDVHQCLGKSKNIAYTTVLTILDRLHKKGLVTRKKQGKAFLYSSRINKKQLAKNLLHRTLTSLTKRYGIDAVAAFAEEINDLPDSRRKKLLNLLKENR